MEAVLLVTAFFLGLLSFFEPCTIATHTLFAVRAHHDSLSRRALALAQLMLSRMGLLALIFGVSAAIGLSALSAQAAMLMLSGIGLVYLVSRKVYLQVPHLEFFRLVPRYADFPQGLKLGLTLPACTLPLVLIVGMLSALTQQPAVAVLAGGVFAIMFSLPTVWGSMRGLGADARVFLGLSAAFSSYFTTALLWGAAIFIGQTGH
ncbi:MAG: hypothetical protein ACYCZA_07160 [Thiobacillus sp.]